MLTHFRKGGGLRLRTQLLPQKQKPNEASHLCHLRLQRNAAVFKMRVPRHQKHQFSHGPLDSGLPPPPSLQGPWHSAGAGVPWVGIWGHLTGPQGQVGSAFHGGVKAWWTRVGRGHSGPAAAGVSPAGYRYCQNMKPEGHRARADACVPRGVWHRDRPHRGLPHWSSVP